MNSAVRTIKTDRDVSSGEFRNAMRHLAGGVSVITVGQAKDITGMTVTSVLSLSVDPPTLIVSINRESSSPVNSDRALKQTDQRWEPMGLSSMVDASDTRERDVSVILACSNR
jgi:hypothetical protein